MIQLGRYVPWISYGAFGVIPVPWHSSIQILNPTNATVRGVAGKWVIYDLTIVCFIKPPLPKLTVELSTFLTMSSSCVLLVITYTLLLDLLFVHGASLSFANTALKSPRVEMARADSSWLETDKKSVDANDAKDIFLWNPSDDSEETADSSVQMIDLNTSYRAEVDDIMRHLHFLLLKPEDNSVDHANADSTFSFQDPEEESEEYSFVVGQTIRFG